MNSLTHRLAVARPLSIMLLLFAGLAVLAWGLGSPLRSSAQGADVQITELSCNSDPEVVVVSNLGQTPIEMTGWNLQSDPTTAESLALQQFGSLSAGETLIVESGPSAGGAFVWSQTPVFRDNDPADFAQLASDEGQVLLKVNCGASSQQTATPAATAGSTPTAAPTPRATSPTPTVLAAASAPVGGGPPGVAISVPPALLIALGGGLLTAGLGTFAFPFSGRRRRHESIALPEPKHSLARAAFPAVTVPKPTQGSKLHTTDDSPSLYVFLIVIALALVGIFLLALQFGGHKEK
jgi:hypothetical protein